MARFIDYFPVLWGRIPEHENCDAFSSKILTIYIEWRKLRFSNVP